MRTLAERGLDGKLRGIEGVNWRARGGVTYYFGGDQFVQSHRDGKAEDGEASPVGAGELEVHLGILTSVRPVLDELILGDAHSTAHDDQCDGGNGGGWWDEKGRSCGRRLGVPGS